MTNLPPRSGSTHADDVVAEGDGEVEHQAVLVLAREADRFAAVLFAPSHRPSYFAFASKQRSFCVSRTYSRPFANTGTAQHERPCGDAWKRAFSR